ncbi:cartilage matrix protein-like [Physella acuta]|uniref:cartilage matrix protein-like n=1 Tax=Physella acuta TaxID=109671 RepID=UPI0027DAE941|nr:cartilage matrix protein-like [Physella acuta]XP_059149258.1 cartilage matrix protein-like [Physella acuta]
MFLNVISPLAVCVILMTVQMTFGEEYKGRHVCTNHTHVTTPVSVRQSYTKATYNSELNKMTYQTAYRTVIRMQIHAQVSAGCCPGWGKRTPRDLSCTQPLCEETCENGGKCVQPGVCHCLEGYTGYRCQIEINECVGRHRCQHTCINTPGSYMCQCRTGFTLAEDKMSCDLCLTCTEEFQEMSFHIDTIMEVKKGMAELQALRNQTVNFDLLEQKLEQKLAGIEGMKTQINSLVDVKQELTDLRAVRKEVQTLKDHEKNESDVVSRLQKQVMELQNVTKHVGEIQILQTKVEKLQELKPGLESLHSKMAKVDLLLEMKNDTDSIRQIRNDVRDIQEKMNEKLSKQEVKKQLEDLHNVKASAEELRQVKAMVESLKKMAPDVESIKEMKKQLVELEEMKIKMAALSGLQKQLDAMTQRVMQLEEEKLVLSRNLTSVMSSFESVVSAVHYSQPPLRDDTTATYSYYDTTSPDRMDSISQQISIMEEKYAICCG